MFRDSCKKVGDKFRNIRNFCGALATVFPGTSSVESDFSRINWEKDESRLSLTDFSLEAILQYQQFEMLKPSVSHYRPSRTLVLVDALSELGGRRLVLDDEGRWMAVDVHRGPRSTYKSLTLGWIFFACIESRARIMDFSRSVYVMF